MLQYESPSIHCLLGSVAFLVQQSISPNHAHDMAMGTTYRLNHLYEINLRPYSLHSLCFRFSQFQGGLRTIAIRKYA